MNAKPEYKYDVAISFLHEDEDLAIRLNNLLKKHVKTFAYFERQKEVAGTDGELTFKRVFGKESRIVVVLYRSGWGDTPWTRFEEDAIRTRAYDDGYDFVTFIPLEDRPNVPNWLPKTRIWIGLDRYGIDSAAAIIEARVQESGGVPREESPLEQASRISQQKLDAKNRHDFLNSERGVTKANEEIGILFNEIESVAAEVTDSGRDIKINFKRNGPRQIHLNSWGYDLRITWRNMYDNTLDESFLEVLLIKRKRFARFTNEKGQTLIKNEYDFDLRPPSEFGWTKKKEKQFISTKGLAVKCIKKLLSRLEEDQPWVRK